VRIAWKHLLGRMTAQAHDSVLFDGQRWLLSKEPLSLRFAAHPDVSEAFRSAPRSTANFRGYLARWSVSNAELYLTELRSAAIGAPEALQEMLPLFAGWVYGKVALVQFPDLRARQAACTTLVIEGGKVEPTQRLSVNFRFTHGLGIHICKLDGIMGHFQEFGALRPWPGSSIPIGSNGKNPSRPFIIRSGRLVRRPGLDDSTDRWGLYAALRSAGLRLD
jgi:hypothetical protein